MMARRSVLVWLVVLGVALGVCSSAGAEWFNYTNVQEARAFAFDGEHVFVGSIGGVVDFVVGTGDFVVTTSVDGLPTSRIEDIAIDGDGVVWAATMRGLASIVGSEVTVFGTENSALLSDSVRAVAVDGSNVKWVGTEEGLYSFDGEDWTRYPFLGPPSLSVSNVVRIGTDGTVWVGTEGGVKVYDGANWTVYTSGNSGLPGHGGENIRDIAFGAGKIWFATYSGVVSFDGRDWEVLHPPTMIPFMEAIAADGAGNVYVGSPAGLLHYDGSEWNVYDTSNSPLPSSVVTSLAYDPDGLLWVGTKGGTATFDGSDWTLRSFGEWPLPNAPIFGIAQDPEGVVWLACNGGGICSIDGETWSVFNSENSGLGDDRAYCVQIAADGTKWFGYYGGLCHFDGSEFETYSSSLGNFATGAVVDLALAPNGDLWAVAQNIGAPSYLCRFRAGSWRVYGPDEHVPSAPLSCLVVDDDGAVWVGTLGQGVGVFQEPFWRVYNTSNSGLPDDNIQCIAKDSSGNIWVGTRSGLAVTDGASWQVFNVTNSMLPSNDIRCVYPASDGSTWVATPEGLCAANMMTWVRYCSEHSGLFADEAFCVFEAQGGAILVGGDAGLSKLTTPSLPSLSEQNVDPQSGPPGTVFTYTVRYTNLQASLEPKVLVYVDGQEHQMTLVSGEPNNGLYQFSLQLERLGSHSCWFMVTDENGARTRRPYSLAEMVPVVEYPTEIEVAPDKPIYTPGDPMRLLATLLNRTDQPIQVEIYIAVVLPDGTVLFFVYPYEFTEVPSGLLMTLPPHFQIEDFQILEVVLEEGAIPFGTYCWVAACVKPGTQFELLSQQSQVTWEFRQAATP